ncbi:unnamed protein product [Somion occarium]|uniref:Uncharacterized protein n=1 Tax=Somion occarium TaxID=3059160 RepID=A0ABP1D7Z1_9APHY
MNAMDFSSNVYLAVTTAPNLSHNPSSLVVHPTVTYVGKVGELADVQVVSVPKDAWDNVKDDVFRALNALDGVQRIEIQSPPRQRVKRGDEL